METMNNPYPWSDGPERDYTQPAPEKKAPGFTFPTGGKELVFALFALMAGMLLCNFTLFGGFNKS